MNTYDDDGLLITDRHVFFFKNKCPFSNFYLSDFTQGSMKYFCSEQYFMFWKAMTFDGNQDIAQKIIDAKTPQECKNLGRHVRNYDDRVWSEKRFECMKEANYLKFSQNEKLKKFIIDKRFVGKIFVEASPYDKIWGIAMKIEDEGIDDERNWNGQNLQGKVINEVREKLLLEN